MSKHYDILETAVKIRKEEFAFSDELCHYVNLLKEEYRNSPAQAREEAINILVWTGVI